MPMGLPRCIDLQTQADAEIFARREISRGAKQRTLRTGIPRRAMSTFRPDTESNRILAAILETSEDAIVAKDPSGRILAWNKSATTLYGYTADEAVGSPIAIIVPPDRRTELDDIMKQVAVGQRVGPLPTIRVSKSGQRIEVLLTVSPIRDDEGRIIGASAVARDLSVVRRLRRDLDVAESRWKAIVESAVDGIIVIDVSGHIESFNAAAERLFGYTSDEVRGHNVSMLMPDRFAGAHDGYLRRYLTSGERHIIGAGREVEGRRKDGTVFPMHLSVGEVSLEGERKFTGIIRDLTERAALETRLRDESALARLGELASVLAHEVRNPLAAVSGAVQMLMDHGNLDADHQEIASEIIRRIDGLSGLVSDLLLYARPPQPKLTPVHLNSLAEVFVQFFRSDPSWQGITVLVEGHCSAVMADPELLKIILQNLLLNAAQAMNGRGRIVIRLSEQSDQANIDISDQGPGIALEVRETLFTPFVTTKVRGTGLGLPTVVRLARAHGGSAAVFSTSSNGTTIRLTLPLAPSLA